MVLDFKKATKLQLLQIVLHEPCSLINKFEAANELKKKDRQGFHKSIKQEKIVRYKN
jgi:hypothetical protein